MIKMAAFDVAWSVLKAARAHKDKKWPDDYMLSWREGGKLQTGRPEDAPYYQFVNQGPASMLPLPGVVVRYPDDWKEYDTSDFPQPARSDPAKQPYLDYNPALSYLPVGASYLEPAARASAANDGTFSTDLSDKRMQEKAKEFDKRRMNS